MGSLNGKVAFITGAARGQGRSHAIRLAQDGADIIAIDISTQVASVSYPTAHASDLAETARQVEALGRKIHAAEADVRDLAALRSVVDEGVAKLGRLDIIVANAGISSNSPLLEMDEEMWQTMIDINLTGVWKTVRAAAPHIVAGGNGGSIVIISSGASFAGPANIGHYVAAKAGLTGMMRTLTKEIATHNIRVNTVHPGSVATEMVLNDDLYRLFRPDLENPTRADFEAAANGMHRLPITLMEPADIANFVAFLVSDEARLVTGSTHAVDAGASA